MIEASFDRRNRRVAVTGAYQYDSGQRLVMRGLPSPDELTGEDDLLSGELPTVQAQFSYIGDSQAKSCLAVWDEWRGVWVVPIPDEYLTRHDDVAVHVNVYYGANESGSRSQTMYEGVFRPISRPAPNNTVSDDQIEQWSEKEVELTLAKTSAETAVTNAAEKADAAMNAADAARKAAQAAQDAKLSTDDAKAVLDSAARSGVANAMPPEAAAGEKGQKGDNGVDGPTDITITFVSGSLTITPKEG